jgi:hypothetical protein
MGVVGLLGLAMISTESMAAARAVVVAHSPIAVVAVVAGSPAWDRVVVVVEAQVEELTALRH